MWAPIRSHVSPSDAAAYAAEGVAYYQEAAARFGADEYGERCLVAAALSWFGFAADNAEINAVLDAIEAGS